MIVNKIEIYSNLEMARLTIEQLKKLKESEDKVEFKRAEQGNFAYDGGSRTKPNERRKCILGYVTAFCNEGGGYLVIGMEDAYPHKVVGTKQCEGQLGVLESDIYRDIQIRPTVYELYEDEVNKTGRVLVIDVPPRPVGKLFKDKAFAMFLDSEQRDLPEEERLSVFEVVALNDIREGHSETVSKEMIKQLVSRNLIEKRGRTRGTYYILSKSYYEFCGEEGEYSYKDDWGINQVVSVIMPHLAKFEKAKMKDFVKLLDGHLTRRQVRLMINQLVDKDYLVKEGEGAATIYKIADAFKQSSAMLARAFDLGIEEMKKRGEIK